MARQEFETKVENYGVQRNRILMFGINVGQVIKGHINEITKQENALYESRIRICKQCPLYTETSLGPVCDSKKCFNPETNQTQSYPSEGYTCGCACRLNAKTRL